MTEKASGNGGSRGQGEPWNSADEVSIADPSSQTSTDMHGHNDPDGQDLLWGELKAVLNAALDEELVALVPAQRLSPENTRE